MPLLVLCFLIGISLVQQLARLPTINEQGGLGLLLLFCLYQRAKYLACALLGVLWAIIIAQNYLTNALPKHKESIDVKVSGYIASLPKYNTRRISFDFNVASPRPNFPTKLRLNWYHTDQVVKVGQYWHFTVKLKRPHGFLNPFGFDYERFLFSQKIGATGYIRQPTPILVPEKNKQYSLGVWRQHIADKLVEIIPINHNLALIKALSIGEKSQITKEQWQILRKTGTLHLLAISGLHIGLVAGFVFFFTQRCWVWTGIVNYSAPTIAAYNALLMAIGYAALANFSIPTQRALIMLGVALLLIVYQRHLQPLTILALALLSVLILDPLAILSAGFWLSFSAVFILMYCHNKRLGQLTWLAKLFKIHFVLTLGLSPLLLLFFQQVSIISPLANFIAIPWVSLIIVPLILSAVALMFLLPSLATELFSLADINLNGLFDYLQRLSDLPFATLPHSQPSLLAMLFAVIGILLLLAPQGIPARGLAWVLLLPLLVGKQNRLNQGEFHLTLLDVGQGLATVIQTAEHILVFDTGAKYSKNFDMGEVVILPYLQGIGASKIDRLIISHGDNDHIGGMPSLIDAITIDAIYSSINQTAIHQCIAGQQWQWDQVSFKFLSPTQKPFHSKNNNSCVLKIDSIYGSALLTGDIEAKAEQRLVNNAVDELKSDVLIAPHHGSKTSSSQPFLAKVQPKWVLIPAGYKNRYHFPHTQVLQRYQQHNITWFSSANSGAIQISMTATGQQLMIYRNQFGKYWNAD
jgi:competence protein ComEC